MLTAVDAHLIRIVLNDDGSLVLHPQNRAASYRLTGQPREDVWFTPEQVVAVRDMVPSLDGTLTGWLDISAGGAPFRVPYRRKVTPQIRELLRLMAECGYPERAVIGEREVLPV
jgi:hypothetical protein